VLRPAPGKQAALILDHVGNVTRHGFPDDHRDWTLDDGIKRTTGTAAPSVRTCPECYAAFKPQPQCPVCGAQCAPITNRKIQQLAGELQELKRVNAQLRAEEQLSNRRQRAAARTLAQLLALAKERGYSPGWAYLIYHARNR
jgi:hypothetical protein